MHQPFGTMGSGSLAAMSILESKYKDNMNEQEAVDLVKEALEAGIFHDLGSGSNVNIHCVRRDGVKSYERYRVYHKKEFNTSEKYDIPKGTTEIIESKYYKWNEIKVETENVTVKMDIV